jgi:tryptophan-rich sensory protein
MMGVAAGLVWDRIEVEREFEKSVDFLCNSIGTNALWSYLFLDYKPNVAGLEIIVLWLMILKPTFNLQKLIRFVYSVFGG